MAENWNDGPVLGVDLENNIHLGGRRQNPAMDPHGEAGRHPPCGRETISILGECIVVYNSVS